MELSSTSSISLDSVVIMSSKSDIGTVRRVVLGETVAVIDGTEEGISESV
jgi:hypothetical protein